MSADRPGPGADLHGDIWVVDRVEGPVAVLIRDGDERSRDVPLQELPAGTRPGTVLRVPSPGGHPNWSAAILDDDARRTRLREAEETLARLRRRDPGGDVKL
ncbi:DUF3006 domain-containing protein [Candidatus Palauibacter sp.]|uniref:DUF3006 domain-containing protein n=1 Tax=Candidatus Palauibacter sp. TaxID=3101350 RepID=UPI003B5B69FA